MVEHLNHDIKVYQINLDFYELSGIKSRLSNVVNHIVEYHKDNFKSDFEVAHSIEVFEKEPCRYTLYSFNERELESFWKLFFPTELIGDKDFTVKSASFALFIEMSARLFCVIGGKGISVIKRFINHSFGLDLYEKIVEPENDVVFSQVSRSVTGNLTSEQRTFRNEQKLQDTLAIGKVPKKFSLILRQDLKDTLFDFIDFGDGENIYLEIGSSFCIKWKLNFGQMHELIGKINEILDFQTTRSLSRFEKIQDEAFINESLLPALLTHLRDDMVRFASTNPNRNLMLDYDFVHPQKLNMFYECDEYCAYTKGTRDPFLTTRDRTLLYREILLHVYTLVEPEDEFEFRRIILGVRVRGFTGQDKKTEAMFVNHLTCELTSTIRPYFLIDNTWYSVKGDFINSLNEQCLQLIRKNLIQPNPLDIHWSREDDEGEYSLRYLSRTGYYVFDRMLGQGIELCDIIYETETSLYLIHIKEGFDAKIRDVTNQVLISASRLWVDLRSEYVFLRTVFDAYSASSNNYFNVSWDEFKLKFAKEIVYVIAFSSGHKDRTVLGNLSEHRSNIAKFSIINGFSEIQTNNNQLRIIEILRDNLVAV
jgi:uncharacterized protein (TIGR04141 family)